MADAVFFSIVALAKAGIESCRNAQICQDEAGRIGKRLTIVVARAHEWGAVCASARLIHFHEVVENVFLCLQAVTSPRSKRSSWNKMFKSTLQSQTLLDKILEAESQLNTAINDLQMEQSNAIFSQLVDVSKGVAELLDQFGTLAMSKSNPSVTVQQQFDKVLADAQTQAPEVAVSIPSDRIHHPVQEYNSLDCVGDEVALSPQQQKIAFRPSKEDVLAISLKASLLEFSDDQKNLLGGGGFAEVFRGTYNHRPVAVKRLKAYHGDVASLSLSQIARDVERLAAEAILTHKCSKHSNIIHVIGCITVLSEVERPLIVMELMHTTLFDALHDRNQKDAMGFSRRLFLLKGIAGALEFLHLQGIVHHDIKSLNILLNKQLTIAKLADFGESKVKGLHTTKLRLSTILATTSHQGNQIAGTAAYQAPEILSEEVLDISRVCEMFSFGVTVWECMTSKIPHGGKKESSIALLAATKKHLPMLVVPSKPKDLPEIEMVSWKALKMVATSCLSRDRLVRPTASVVVALWHKVKSPGNVEPLSFSLQNPPSAKSGGIGQTWLPTSTQGSTSQDIVFDTKGYEDESKAGYTTSSKKRCYIRLSVIASIVVLLGVIVLLAVILVPRSSPDPSSPLPAHLSFQTTQELYDAVDAYVGTTSPVDSTAATVYGYPIGSWDVSRISNFSQVFDGSARNSAIGMFDEDLSNWDVSAASTMHSMFNGAYAFNSNLSAWNVSRVADMSFMFWGASAFNGDLSSWRVDRVASMESMFEGASSFNGDLALWNVSQVTDMSFMFWGASSFNGDLSTWRVDQVSNMESMFYNASAFNSDLAMWNVGQVTDMSFMFWGASSFNGDLSSWRVDNVANMESMFYNTKTFNSDVSAWNVDQVINMSSMFQAASVFNADLSSWNVMRVTNMRAMFEEAGAFNGDVSTWNVGQVTDMSFMFWHASSFNGNLFSWRVDQVASMESMFQFAAAFNGDLSSWNVSKVTTMQEMFNGASSFEGNLCPWLAWLPLDCNVDGMFLAAQSCTDTADPILPDGPMCNTCAT
jgi:surface protein